jgi:hypothetical protein
MNVYRHAPHTVYSIKKGFHIMKQHNKMLFWHRGKLVPNFRFSIRPHKQWQFFHLFIRLPYFYFEKHNTAIMIGTPNLYLWVQKRK